MTVFVVAVILALSVSFVCSMLESSLLSLSTTDIADISQKKPAVARIWTGFKNNIQRPIAVILILNTIAHTIGATVSGAKFTELFGPQWVGLYSVVFSFVMIQWTEILPKTWGVRYTKSLAPITAYPMQFMIRLLSPLVWLTRILNRPFEGRKGQKQELNALQEINILTRFAALNRQLNQDQGNIIQKSIALSHASVSDIMVKKDGVRFLSTKMTLMEALIEAHIVHHTRFPLIEGDDTEKVIGYVNFKDIVSALQINPQDPSLRGILRPILTVRVTDTLTALLTTLTSSSQHIAVVRSESGRLEGLVTLEDLIEFLFGKLQDEYDNLPTYRYQIAGNRWLLGGGVTLAQARELAGTGIPASDRTVNDWVHGCVPGGIAVEQKCPLGDFSLIIRKIRNGKIYEVILEKNPPQPAPAALVTP
jgi:CBS domain containing-hemolysin-like protein